MKRKIKNFIIPLVLTTAICMPFYSPATVFAEGNLGNASVEESRPEYFNIKGQIEEINLKDGSSYIIVGNGETRDQVVYNISADTVLMNNSGEFIKASALKNGQTVMAAYKSNTIMTASLPPQINPEVIILIDTEKAVSAKVDKFDENFLSSDGDLILNLDNKSDCVDKHGNKVSISDLKNKNLIVLYSITTFSIPPQTPPIKVVLLDNAVKTAEYVNKIGIVEDIVDYPGSTGIVVNVEGNEQTIYHITDSVILDAKTQSAVNPTAIAKGQKVLIAHKLNVPATLSIPPQISAEAIVIMNDETMSVKVDVFDNELLSSDGGLVLNISDQTNIVDKAGNKVSADGVKNETLVVFYKMTTRSIPPQTSPVKVVVISEKQPTAPEQTDNMAGIMENVEVLDKNGVKYVALAALAKQLGFEVSWDDSTKTVTLAKGPVTYTISIGSKQYGYNKAIEMFTNEPFINNGRTFVEIDFLSKIGE